MSIDIDGPSTSFSMRSLAALCCPVSRHVCLCYVRGPEHHPAQTHYQCLLWESGKFMKSYNIPIYRDSQLVIYRVPVAIRTVLPVDLDQA